MWLDILLLALAGFCIWLSLQNRTLHQRQHESEQRAAIVQSHLDAERRNSQELVTMNYNLAKLNEELFIALDRSKAQSKLLRCWVDYLN